MRNSIEQIFHKRNGAWGSASGVRISLEAQPASFLRKRRGDLTCAEFSKKLGLPPSALHRLENGAQSITLRSLQQIMDRLKCTLGDIFGKQT